MICEECIYPDEFQILCGQGRNQYIKDFAQCEEYEPVKKLKDDSEKATEK